MSIDSRTPCIIGVAQRTVHPGEGPSPEPLDLWEDVCRRLPAGWQPDFILLCLAYARTPPGLASAR